VPGLIDPVEDSKAAIEAARRIGYPIAIKAAAGGGGKGIRVVRQGARNQDFLGVDKRIDGRGSAYYWLGYRPAPFEAEAGTDLEAVRAGYVAITPLQLDLTDGPAMGSLAEAFGL
jgi:broad specificity polyphosphatase/5'/3'-nucleotidase SurE